VIKLSVVLTPLQTLQGALTLVFVLISFILGLTIMLKYFKYKVRQLLLVGATWMFVVSPYWPDAISFVMIMFTGQEININLYFFIANAFIAPLHITWMLAMTDFLFKKHQKLIMLIFSIEAVIFEIIFIVVFSMGLPFIGTKISVFVVRWELFIMLYILISLLFFVITGLLFARESTKSSNQEIRLKGKFIVIAFILFTLGSLLDVLIDIPTETTIALDRIFMILAAFSFYIGFIMPNFIKKIFIRD